MNPIVEAKVYRMYLEVEKKGIEETGRFVRELNARHFFGTRGTTPCRGFHKIEIREYAVNENCLFLEVPIKRTEKMIELGWTFQ